jgi:hypothetical protein
MVQKQLLLGYLATAKILSQILVEVIAMPSKVIGSSHSEELKIISSKNSS